MQLDDTQKQKVASWIQEGAKLSDIQTRLDQELGMRLTYMDVRLLVSDLQLTPKDPEPPEKPAAAAADASGAAPAEPVTDEFLPPDEVLPPETSMGGKVKLEVDQITRAGALVSGKVTFSDNQRAAWYLDQFGRLGMTPEKEGYRPSEMDVADFQRGLERELMKLGY